MFDKKIIRNCIIIILIVVLMLFGIKYIRRAFSRYESDGEADANLNLAFWVVNESFVIKEFSLGEIQPLLQDEGYNREDYVKKVEFSVQNYKENSIISANVPIRYDIKVKATTNLPLKYKLYQYGDDDVLKTEPCEISEKIIQDSYGTSYKEIKANSNSLNGNDFFFDKVDGNSGKEKDKFILEVWLPYDTEEYNNVENYVFADLIEYIEIEINAKQIISEDEFI